MARGISTQDDTWVLSSYVSLPVRPQAHYSVCVCLCVCVCVCVCVSACLWPFIIPVTYKTQSFSCALLQWLVAFPLSASVSLFLTLPVLSFSFFLLHHFAFISVASSLITIFGRMNRVGWGDGPKRVNTTDKGTERSGWPVSWHW